MNKNNNHTSNANRRIYAPIYQTHHFLNSNRAFFGWGCDKVVFLWNTPFDLFFSNPHPFHNQYKCKEV